MKNRIFFLIFLIDIGYSNNINRYNKKLIYI